MHCHSCYRLLAALDITISCFAFIVWVVVFLRSEGLIRLQFEVHPHNESLIGIIGNYRANIPAIGTLGSEEESAELLRELYEEVQTACKDQKPWETENKLRAFLELYILLILIAILGFIVLSFVMACSTRNGRAGNKKCIVAYFLLHLLFTLQYGISGVQLFTSSQLCAVQPETRVMKSLFGMIVCFFKPLQIFVSFKYYRNVAKGEYVEEVDSSEEEGSITSGISSNEDYISRSKTGMGVVVQNSRIHIEKQEDIDNMNKVAPVYRQVNATDIPNSHDLQLQRARKGEKKLVVRGKGLVPLNKVSPEENFDLT